MVGHQRDHRASIRSSSIRNTTNPADWLRSENKKKERTLSRKHLADVGVRHYIEYGANASLAVECDGRHRDEYKVVHGTVNTPNGDAPARRHYWPLGHFLSRRDGRARFRVVRGSCAFRYLNDTPASIPYTASRLLSLDAWPASCLTEVAASFWL